MPPDARRDAAGAFAGALLAAALAVGPFVGRSPGALPGPPDGEWAAHVFAWTVGGAAPLAWTGRVSFPGGQLLHVPDPLHAAIFRAVSAVAGPDRGVDAVLVWGVVLAAVGAAAWAAAVRGPLGAARSGAVALLAGGTTGLLLVPLDGMTEALGAGFAPAVAAATLALGRPVAGRWGAAAALALGVAGAAWSGVYGLLGAALGVAAGALSAPRRGAWVRAGAVALGLALGAPVLRAAGGRATDAPGGAARAAEAPPDPPGPPGARGGRAGGVDLLDLVVPGPVWPAGPARPVSAYVGLVALGLAARGLRRARGGPEAAAAWVAAGVGLGGLVLALGPSLWVGGRLVPAVAGALPAGWAEALPVLDRLSRYPRFGAVGALLLAPLVAGGLPARALPALAVALVGWGELRWAGAVPALPVATPALPAATGTALPAGAVLDLPLHHPVGRPGVMADAPLRAALAHGRPLVAPFGHEVRLDAAVAGEVALLERVLRGGAPADPAGVRAAGRRLRARGVGAVVWWTDAEPGRGAAVLDGAFGPRVVWSPGRVGWVLPGE